MEHERCAGCRNPVRDGHPAVRHAAAGRTFHLDCWRAVHEAAQRAYVDRVRDDGLLGLMLPYCRSQRDAWLPREADEPVPAVA